MFTIPSILNHPTPDFCPGTSRTSPSLYPAQYPPQMNSNTRAPCARHMKVLSLSLSPRTRMLNNYFGLHPHATTPCSSNHPQPPSTFPVLSLIPPFRVISTLQEPFPLPTDSTPPPGGPNDPTDPTDPYRRPRRQQQEPTGDLHRRRQASSVRGGQAQQDEEDVLRCDVTTRRERMRKKQRGSDSRSESRLKAEASRRDLRRDLFYHIYSHMIVVFNHHGPTWMAWP